jgi:hypothetical protein
MPTAFKIATIATVLLTLFLTANWMFEWRVLIVYGDANIVGIIFGCAAIWVFALGWQSVNKGKQ